VSSVLAGIGSRWAWFVLPLFCLIVGCAPKIGDHCSISTDCSANGDRLCDTTQPGGYCTIFNCEPNSCPEEAVCVAFNEKSCPDTTPAAGDAGVANSVQSVRFQRTFCMLTCNGDGDCRSGYVCLDTSSDPARQVVDINPSSVRICTVPPLASSAGDAQPPVATPVPAVCLPPDASFEPWESTEGGSSSTPESSDDATPASEADVDSAVDAATE
jgi:hypothetical protein